MLLGRMVMIRLGERYLQVQRRSLGRGGACYLTKSKSNVLVYGLGVLGGGVIKKLGKRDVYIGGRLNSQR